MYFVERLYCEMYYDEIVFREIWLYWKYVQYYMYVMELRIT